MKIYDLGYVQGSLGVGFSPAAGPPAQQLEVRGGSIAIENAYRYFIGTDCELYRNGANEFRTPDSFLIDGKLTVNNSNAAVSDGSILTKTFGSSLNAEKSSLLLYANYNAVETTGSALMQGLRINTTVNYTSANSTTVYPIALYSTASGSGGVTPNLFSLYSGGQVGSGHTVTSWTQLYCAAIGGAGSVGTYIGVDLLNQTVSATNVFGIRGRIQAGANRFNLYLDGTAPSLFAGQIQSTLATGTAPFSVASSTLVVNLNADRLDGQDGSYYAAASSLASYAPLGHTHGVGDIDSITSGNLLGRYSAGTGQAQQIIVGSGLSLNPGTGVLTASGSGGTVTSVGLSAPLIFSVGGSPVTSSGSLSLSLVSQTANKVFASPNGTTGVPDFRALVAADIPNLSATILTSGVIPNGRLNGTYTGILGISVDDLTVTDVLEVQNYIQVLGSDNALAAVASTAGTVWHPVFENNPSGSPGVIRYKTGAEMLTALGVADVNSRVAVRKNSAGSVYTRRRINFIQGGGCTITIADDSGSEEIDVTISVP